jgi:hypothetical protein
MRIQSNPINLRISAVFSGEVSVETNASATSVAVEGPLEQQ